MAVIRRLAGVVVRPRTTLAGLVTQPAWALAWVAILSIWALCGAWLLSTDYGQQALVDERVRVVEAMGGTVTDAAYAALQANPPWWVYFTSGSRALLLPPVTLLVAGALWVVARVDGARPSAAQALALAVHATTVLALGQVVATPLHYVRESLTSPLNLAAVLPLMEDGLPTTRFFGTLDLFALWWAGLLALALSALTGRRVRRYAWPLAGIVAGFAAIVAGVLAVLGGS